ncbi:PREDICTED: uncharacterized protein LOC109115855 [Nelumbo nucifera]|uniref:Uncharacterized protein LOC109115855 n=1 Tax=Nelumbo nucifera TaxID=4432 RepID=A0A1U8QAQ2_NELNU|nr:PREDICTED: uncharacterized protein LOC109115855 [Nelumbo nucifera]
MSPVGLLQPLPIPEQIWEDIAMDFIETLPKSKGFDTIMVVVDRLSKYAHFIPLSHPFSGLTVAQAFLHNIVHLHGIPRSIVSDRDKVFMSFFWRELFTLQGSELHRSSAYHPQMVVYGRDPPPLIRYELGFTANADVEVVLLHRDAILGELRAHLHRAQQKMKDSTDANQRNVNFDVGNLVICVVAYKFQLPPNARIHPVFHVSQLKKAIGNHISSPVIPSTLSDDMEMLVELVAVQGVHPSTMPGVTGSEVLIHWPDLPDFEDSWEPFDLLRNQFPHFNLEDKVRLWVAGNDRPPINLTYARKRKGQQSAKGGNN